MIDCYACAWRCLRAICHDTPLRSAVRLNYRTGTSRSYANVSSGEQRSNRHTSRPSPRDDGYPQSSNRRSRKQEPDRKQLLAVSISNSNSKFDIERSSTHNHLKRELPWLRDPLKLAERTRVLLNEGNRYKALELVRLASKEGQVTICWNAVIQHLLRDKKIHEAVKVYNEMKKRAQFPDAFTYSILLSGLSDNAKMPHAVERAVAIFHSMSGPTSRVSPGIIHTNSALRACSRANDMDSLWNIASTIPERGPHAANSITFTTIINAMRMNAIKGVTLSSTVQQSEARDSAVRQARQMWEDIINRWHRGQLMMDEDLVCAMGRLLLIGTRPQDWDDTLSLIEQTTNIWRQAPALRSGQNIDSDGKLLPPPVGHLERAPVGEQDPDAGKEFDPVPMSLSLRRAALHKSKSASINYVKPSNNTFSLVLEACQKLMLKSAAEKYWAIFTNPEGLALKPDEDNCHIYLRILRQAKASAAAVKMVRNQMADCEPMQKTYRIAMSTCVRNEMSPNATRDASALMDLMQSRLPQMDVKTCIMWMQLALRSPHGSDVYNAIERLGPHNINLKEIVEGGDKETAEEVVNLLRLMMSGADRLKNDGILRDDQKAEFALRRSKWDALVARFGNGEQKVLPEEKKWAIRKEKKIERFARKKETIRARTKKEQTLASGRMQPRSKPKIDDAMSQFEHEAM